MIKFYVIKRDERFGDGYKGIVEFTDHNQLEKYIAYHRNYIEEMHTIGEELS